MTRWIMVGLTVFGFAISFITKSPGLLGVGVLCGFVGLIGTAFAITAERVSSRMRPDMAMLTPEDLAALKKRTTSSTVAQTNQRLPATPSTNTSSAESIGSS